MLLVPVVSSAKKPLMPTKQVGIYRTKLNLVGQKFGRLEVVSSAPKQGVITFWNCHCDCGANLIVRTNQLRNGHTKSCGCFKRDIAIKRFTKHGLAARGKQTTEYHLYHSAKKRAKRDRLPFDLELSDIIIPEFCPVFLTLELKQNIGRTQDNSPTLDKLVPTLGYVKGNVRVISHKANTIKQAATFEEIARVAEWLKGELNAK